MKKFQIQSNCKISISIRTPLVGDFGVVLPETTLKRKALVFLYAFKESVDCHPLSSFCDNSNLHISIFKCVFTTMGISKESINKFLIGNRFHVKLRILSPKNCKQSLRVKIKRLK